MVIFLSDNIRNMRVARGMNQVELGKMLGVSKQCISNWENDNVIPSVEMLVKIADFFNVTTDEVIGRTDRVCIDVSGLTDEQIAHISNIVKDSQKLN